MRAHPERALRAHRLLPGSECLPAVRRAPTLTRAGYQIAASTPLQMMLYFSVPYGLLFAVANQMLFYWKARTFDVPLVVAVVSPMMFWIWFDIDRVPDRGNLRMSTTRPK